MFESILESSSSTTSLSIQTVVICWITALVLGLVIAFVHKITSKHTTSFLLSLSILPLLVQVVMMMVNGNLGNSVAILGAFGLIRFRSMPGSAKEIVSIFWAMAIGLAVGMGQIIFAICVTIIVAIAIILLNKFNFGEKDREDKQLKIIVPENLDYTSIFDEIFDKYLEKCNLEKVKTTNMGSMYEMTYEVKLKKDIKEKELIDDIRVKNGNLPVSLYIAQDEMAL